MEQQEPAEDSPPAKATFFAPPDDLAACFTTFYKVEITAPADEVLVDYLLPEWSNLRFFKGSTPRLFHPEGEGWIDSRYQATGPSSRPARFEIDTCTLWGIGLLPLGWARFVQAPAAEFANRAFDGETTGAFRKFAPLHEILFASGNSDDEKYTELGRFFHDLAPPPRDTDRILRLHEAMVDPYLVEVGALADVVGLTTRTLERVCSRHFGFPPRLLIRRQRLIRSLAAFMLSDGKSWTETIDRHYHDQAHFVHEFQALMGMSPSQYMSMGHPVISAFMAIRKKIWGSPAQTLDRPDNDNGAANGGAK